MTRAVLIAPRGREDAAPQALDAMIRAMSQLAEAGVELVGIIDPDNHLQAIRMVLDGRADFVVATRPDHMPALRILGDEAWFRSGVVGTSAAPPVGERRPRRPTSPDGVKSSMPACEEEPAGRQHQPRAQLIPRPVHEEAGATEPAARRRPRLIR